MYDPSLHKPIERHNRSHEDHRTSQVLDEVLHFHLPLGLHIWAVHVCVEKDDGKRQDEDGVRVLKLSDQHWVAHAVSLTEGEKHMFY